MRESVLFELRLRRFGVWRLAIVLVASAAVAAMAAWAASMWDSQEGAGRTLISATAAALSLATILIAVSLGRVEGGLLTWRDGVWTFLSDTGRQRSGPLEVAMDLGGFLLLRLVVERKTTAWLPVQRRGVEDQWHGLRCAAYSRPPLAPSALGFPRE